MHESRRTFLLIALGVLSAACNNADSVLGPTGGTPADWPDDVDQAYSAFIADDRGDFEIAPGGAPPYSAPMEFAPIDVTRISLAVIGDHVYMRIDFDGVIPTGPVEIPASGEVEAQTVYGQSFSVNLDSDNDDATGANGEGVWGVDLFFAINALYGREFMAYANYDFPTADIHVHRGNLDGELGEGGPGSRYAVLRYDMSSVDARFFPRGTTVEIGSWSEAESDLYHHFAFDPQTATTWDIPRERAGGLPAGWCGTRTLRAGPAG